MGSIRIQIINISRIESFMQTEKNNDSKKKKKKHHYLTSQGKVTCNSWVQFYGEDPSCFSLHSSQKLIELVSAGRPPTFSDSTISHLFHPWHMHIPHLKWKQSRKKKQQPALNYKYPIYYMSTATFNQQKLYSL